MNTALYATVMAGAAQSLSKGRLSNFKGLAEVVRRVCDKHETSHPEALVKEVLQRWERKAD